LFSSDIGFPLGAFARLLHLGIVAVRRRHAQGCLRHIHLMLRLRVLHFLLLGRRFQMRIEQRHLGIELGLDPGQLDFGLGLDLLMNASFCAFC
jgi:hypothetical protein